MKALVTIFFSGMLLLGCESLRSFLGFGYTKPEVSLKSIEIDKVTLSGIDMKITLNVTNRNSFDIKFHKLDYRVSALGYEVAQGLFEKRVNIKAEGQQVVVLPLTINKKNALDVFLKLVQKRPAGEESKAVIEATVLFDSPVGEIEHKFVDEKEIGNIIE